MSVDHATEYQSTAEQVEAQAQARRRRFVGLAVPRPRALRRAQVITEGSSTHDVVVREGLYRRALGTSDALMAGLVLWLVVGVRAGGGLDLWTFIAMPLMVIVNKIAGLYERDEIVLKKTTLDEAPALIQITGLFSLLVWLGHTDFFGAAPTPNQVLLLWVGTFGALSCWAGQSRERSWRVSRGPERCFLIGDQAALDRAPAQARCCAGERRGRRRSGPLAEYAARSTTSSASSLKRTTCIGSSSRR